MRIVVKAPNWLGDAVMSLPTLCSLREMEPKAHIAVLVRRPLADLYRGSADVDDVIGYETWLAAVRSLKKAAFDTALILPRSFSSAFMAFTARIGRRIGYRGEGRAAMLTHPVERDDDLLRVHRVRYYHHLLTPLGKPPAPKAPRLRIPDEARAWAKERLPGEDWVGINPGATYGTAKQWYPDRFVDVARRLSKRGLKAVVVGGPSEAELGDRVAREAGGLSLAGRTSILQLAAVIERCRLFLTNDTGPMHVADAVGTPIAAVFGPTDWRTTPPYGKSHEIVRTEIECAPCLERVCPLKHHDCMKRVSADDVEEACGRLLERKR